MSDITVYGATGFVAQHVILYLIQTSKNDLRLTLAGRNRSKLQERQAYYEKIVQHQQDLGNVGTVVLDVYVAIDEASFTKLCERTKVVIGCAGPFASYGSGIVKACVQTNTHYCDITGEVAWSAEMRRTCGSTTARIVSFCGFDSIPSDLAVYCAVEALRAKQKDVEIQKAVTYHAMFGLPNGGTLRTAVDMPLSWKNILRLPVPYLMDDPLALAAPSTEEEEETSAKNRLATAEWWNQLIHFHSIFLGGASAPHPMAVVNSKVVQASAHALAYGKDFVYYERYLPAGFRMTLQLKTLSFIPALLTQLGFLLGLVILKIPILGNWLLNRLAPPGSGVSDELCRVGFAEVYAEVSSPPKPDGTVDRANTFLKFKGDPGNLVTAQCVGEAAWCLLDDGKLPPNSADGFGTPAQLLGPCLMERLMKTKIRPLTFESDVRLSTSKVEWRMFP